MGYYEFPHTRNYDTDLGYLIKRYFELDTDFESLEKNFNDLKDWCISQLNSEALKTLVANKLDEWLQDGTLASLINNALLHVTTYDTVVEMLTHTGLEPGSKIYCTGADSVNDGKGGHFRIRSRLSTDTIDNYNLYLIDGGVKVAERITDDISINYVTPKMFGAVGDGVTDDTLAFKELGKSGLTVLLDNKTYVINGNIDIVSNTKFIGRNTIIKSTVLPDEFKVYCFVVQGDNVEISGITFLNVFRAISSDNSNFLYLHDLKISSHNFGIRLSNTSYFTIENIYFEQKDIIIKATEHNYTNTDGVHINGDSHDGVIRNITGHTSDDMISLCSYDGFETGNINNILIENVTSTTENIVTDDEIIHDGATFNTIRILYSHDSIVDNVIVKNINTKNWFTGGITIDCGTDTLPDKITNFYFENCKIENINNISETDKLGFCLTINNSNSHLKFMGCTFTTTRSDHGMVNLLTKTGSNIEFDSCLFSTYDNNDYPILTCSNNSSNPTIVDTIKFINTMFTTVRSLIGDSDYISGNNFILESINFTSRNSAYQSISAPLKLTDKCAFNYYKLINSELKTNNHIMFIEGTIKNAYILICNNVLDSENQIVRLSVGTPINNELMIITIKGNTAVNNKDYFSYYTLGQNSVRLNCDTYVSNINLDLLKAEIGDVVNVGSAVKLFNGSQWI